MAQGHYTLGQGQNCLHRHAAFWVAPLLTEAFVLKDQVTLHSKLTELISSEHIIVQLSVESCVIHVRGQRGAAHSLVWGTILGLFCS